MKGTLGGLVVAYLLIGLAIVSLQQFTGTTCDPMRTTPMVTANTPSGLLGVVTWPLGFYQQVWENSVPVREYFSPTICVEKQ